MPDPAQIPPINRLDSIPFGNSPLYNFRRSELTEIMRQKADNPIIAKSLILRENLTKIQPIPVLKTELNSSDCGIIHLDSVHDRDKLKPLLNEFFNSKSFEEDANYAKVIAWRNKTVNYMNQVIRELLYGKDAPIYVVGEKLITNSPIFANQGPYSGILLNNSEELTILSIEEKKTKFYEKSYSLDADIYSIQVEVFDPEDREMVKKRITVIRGQSLQEYAQLCASVKAKAIQAGIKDIWVSYFNIMKWSANVRYNYAITSHKSQGSSYTNVFLLEEDLDFNRTVVERNRIKYTSYTRPTNKLFILRNNY